MRKLALFSFAFSAAAFLVYYFIPLWLAAGIGAGSLICVLLFCIVKMRRTNSVKFAKVILSGLFFGFSWYIAYYFLFCAPLIPLKDLVSDYTVKLLDYPRQEELRTSIKVSVLREGKPDANAVLYIYNNIEGELPDLRPGDVAAVVAKCNVYAEDNAGDLHNAKHISIALYARGMPEVYGKDHFAPIFWPAELSRLIKDSAERIFTADTSGFMKALLTGDKFDFYANSYSISLLSSTGTSHIVAISGMHLSFLVGILRLIFGKRKLSALICIPVILFFMAMVGFSPSVTRAGIMQIMLIAASLFGREYDSYTALGVALLLILIADPTAVGDTGLQLSFASVLGILLFANRLKNYMTNPFRDDKLNLAAKFYSYKPCKILINFVISSLSVTLAALSLVTPLSVLSFGSIPLIAPVSNLIILWAVSFAFSLGFVSVFLTLIFAPLGIVPAYVCSLLVRYVLSTLGLLVNLSFSVLYTRNLLISVWFICAYTTLAVVIFFKKIKKKPLVFIIPVALTLVFTLALNTVLANAKPLVVTLLDSGQGQCVVLNSYGSRVVVDCGGSSRVNAGDNAAEYIMSLGGNGVDALILTHFDSDHINGAAELMRRIRVSRLIVPYPGYEVEEEIINTAYEQGVEVLYVSETVTMIFGGMELQIFPPLGKNKDNESGISLLCNTVSGFNVLITGDMNSETELRLLEYAELPKVDLYIAGHHGSAHSSSQRLLDAIQPKIAFISVGYNNYGHPSEETLSRLASIGARVYRTDLSGEISLTLN